MWFRPKHSKPPIAPAAEPVDHSLADAAIHDAIKAHTEAQAQATQAREIVDQLRQVNVRNGFAPAIRASFNRPIGGSA